MSSMPATAAVRLFAAEPPLAPAAAADLAAALGKLLAQFVREGRCTAFEAATEQDGRFVVVAWDGPALSGCSHDKIAQVVAQHEERSGSRLLDVPPIAVGSPVRLVDRAGLRALLASSEIAADAPWWDLRAADLGAWRAGPVPLGRSPFARLAGAPS